jgi:hypothetical protein
LDILERVLLNAARTVVGATARCSSEGLYTETAWEPLHERRAFHRLTMMYNIINMKAPQYLIDLLPNRIQGRTEYNLRNRTNLDPPRTRLNIHAKSFFPWTVRAWNKLNVEVQNLPSTESFKAWRKRLSNKKEALYYYGTRLESAIHARMRMLNSPLKAHLHDNLHVIESPLCPCGAGVPETSRHFLFECALFVNQREELTNNLLPLVITPRNYKHMLFGIPNNDHITNMHVFDAVHQYIKDTRIFY